MTYELRPHHGTSLSVVINNSYGRSSSHRATLTADGLTSTYNLTSGGYQDNALSDALTAMADRATVEQGLKDAVMGAWQRARNLTERPPSPARTALLGAAVAHAKHCQVLHTAFTTIDATQRQTAFSVLEAGFDGTADELRDVIAGAYEAASCAS